MIRKLMASSALAVLMSAGAFGPAQAQDTNAQQPPVVDQATQPAQVGDANETLQPEQPTLATAFMGRSVYASEAPDSDNIGEVNDLIISDDGSITDAIVGVGGFLGIGEKNVAVPFDQLRVVERDGAVSLIYAATREQLEQAPAFDRAAYDPAARSDGQTTDTAMAPADGGAMTADGDQMAAAPATAPAMDASGDAMTAPAPADSGDMATAQNDATNAETAAPPADMEFVSFNEDQLRSSDLMGANVYGQDDQSIGSISDLVLDPNGGARSALIDVGGFLGIGAKTVAIPVSELTIEPDVDSAAAGTAGVTAPATTADGTMAAAPADGTMAPATTDGGQMAAAPDAAPATGDAMAPAAGDQMAAADGTAATTDDATLADGNVRVTVAMSREQIEQLPEYVSPADAANQAADATAPADADAMATSTADGTVATDQTAAAEQPMDASGATTEPATTGSVATEYTAATQELAASELNGANVYGPDDASVGSIGDLVLDRNGDIQAVIVDVGGFLGLGAKPVALSFNELNVRRDENGTLMARIDATKEQLTNAPTYEEQAAQQ